MQVQVQSRSSSWRLWLQQSSLIYEDEYLLLAIISAVDVMVNYFYLQMGGHLFSGFVDSVIIQGGLMGMLTFKLLVVALVVICCETLGVRNASTGRKLITLVNTLAMVALAVAVYEIVMV